MNDALTAMVEGILDTVWTYFLDGQQSNMKLNDGSTANIQAAHILGYGGAAVCFFLGMAGAYAAGASVIVDVQASFFGFLEDFQDNDLYRVYFDGDSETPTVDPVTGEETAGDEPGLEKFLNKWGFNFAATVGVFMWHVGVIIGVSLVTSFDIFYQIQALDVA